jgi:hypothetical protein
MTPNKFMPNIIIVIDAHGGEFHGTRDLACAINAETHIARFMRYARELEQLGEITICRGNGRGNKTIFKRNRNSTGLPRKVRA